MQIIYSLLYGWWSVLCVHSFQLVDWIRAFRAKVSIHTVTDTGQDFSVSWVNFIFPSEQWWGWYFGPFDPFEIVLALWLYLLILLTPFFPVLNIQRKNSFSWCDFSKILRQKSFQDSVYAKQTNKQNVTCPSALLPVKFRIYLWSKYARTALQ